MTQLLQKLSAADEGLELSRDEYASADFTGPDRFERRAGRLVVNPPPGHDHHSTSDPIRDFLGAYRIAHPDLVEHVFGESWASVDDGTDRLPDIAVYLNTPEKRGQRIPDRVPDLVFEVVSPGWANRKRDYEEKREEYGRIGVLEYVIVDRFDQCVTVLTLGEDGYSEDILKPTDTYTTPLLPGLEIPLEPIIG